MEILNVSISSISQVPSRISFVTPKPSIQFPNSANSYRFRKSHLKPYPYPTHFPLPCCKRFHVSAQFGRRSTRRSSLRRKLTEDLQVRRKNPQNPTFEFDDANAQSNLGASGKEVGSENGNVSEIDSGVDPSGRGKGAGESVLWNKLEGWVEQHKKDIEFWGIGSGPIFTVYQDLDGNVERVVVDEDEIVRRSRILPSDFREAMELDESDEVSSKISHARFVAEEMEKGNFMLSKSSSVARFVVSGDNSRLVSRTKSGSLASDFNFIPSVSSATKSGLLGSKSNFVPIVSRFGIVPLCGLILVWAVKKLFSMSEGEKELTRLEKEILRRKMKSRKRKEKLEDSSVEVVPELILPDTDYVERPRLDKEELMNSIKTAMQSNNQMGRLDVASTWDTASMNVEGRIQEIRDMARHACEVEKHGHSSNEQPSIEIETIRQPADELLDVPDNLPSESLGKAEDTDDIVDKETEKRMGTDYDEATTDVVPGEEGKQLPPSTSAGRLSEAERSSALERKDSEGSLKPLGTASDSNHFIGQSSFSKEVSRKKPRVIRSVAEARKYLSGKHHPQLSNGDPHDNHIQEGSNDIAKIGGDTKVTSDHLSERFREDTVSDASAPYCSSNGVHPRSNGLNGKAQSVSLKSASAHDPAKDEGSNVNLIRKEEKISDTLRPDTSIRASKSIVKKEASQDPSLKENEQLKTAIDGVNMEVNCSIVQSRIVHNLSCDKDANPNSRQSSDHKKKMNDTVKPAGLDECDTAPAVNASDFKEKQPLQDELKNQDLSATTSEVSEEYEEKLKIKASTVKDNWLEKNFDELLPVLEKMGTGFNNNYMVAKEKVKQEFDRGSELTKLQSVLNENTELEWMNDDKLREIVFKVRDNELAGRDPFHSLDDEDKVIFYKGLEEKVEKESEKLSTLHEWLHANIENLDYGADGISVYDPPEKIIPRWKGAPFDKIREFLANAPEDQKASFPREATDPVDKNLPAKLEVSCNTEKPHIRVANKLKTVIESSDGSVRPGKKTGKEHWQHTKKHSRGFLESYNAETDPEIKAVMRDMGKDLDRWITEEEIKKAAKLMVKLPRRSKAFIEKKLNKVRSEVERFGTQAVLSKYREYAVEEEEDYLWWLDLTYVLCIELYTHDGDELKVGFYTFEMAADLELEPKPFHVIAFEDPGDCKNLCYIIQSHMEMLGKGDKAFVVAQPPKEAFRDAKANGFGVTVIRKGELTLNVDQPLEEVEELISEIGSKMYHDKIMKERSVDIRSVMKGVLATSKPAKRKSVKRRRLKKPKN